MCLQQEQLRNLAQPNIGAAYPDAAFAPKLQLQQPFRRVDDHSSRREIDFLHDLFRHGNQILFRFALNDVEIAAGGGPEACDFTDVVALCVE